ncbi:polysaccharide deacetylase family protein [Trinickia sp.]|uniref:polysaccharide deacetylase family protein n=1 Tax=Trinickia sp. TaxID=2571163 RepID=UPI003F818AC2
MNPTLAPLVSRPSSAIAAGAPRRWRPTPALAAIIAVHAGAAVFAAAQPASWPYALAAIVVSHAIAVAAGLWPRSALLGPNWTRLPEHVGAQIAITIDDGPDPEVTPQVLDLLDRYEARATFFCIGERALRHPALVASIVARGHSVENHSQRHRHYFSLLGPRAIRREIEAAQRTLTESTGTAPLFFRAPAGLRNPFLEPVLCALGLQLASWTRRGFDTRASDAALVAERLLRGLAPRDIVLLHDGNAARDEQGRPVILDALETVLRGARDAGLSCVTLRAALASARAFSSAAPAAEAESAPPTR